MKALKIIESNCSPGTAKCTSKPWGLSQDVTFYANYSFSHSPFATTKLQAAVRAAAHWGRAEWQAASAIWTIFLLSALLPLRSLPSHLHVLPTLCPHHPPPPLPCLMAADRAWGCWADQVRHSICGDSHGVGWGTSHACKMSVLVSAGCY